MLQMQKLGVLLFRQTDLELERFVSSKGMWNSVSSQARSLYTIMSIVISAGHLLKQQRHMMALVLPFPLELL